MVVCPICGGSIHLPEDPVESEIFDCEECGSDLEIISLDPILLQEAPSEGEDWGE